MKKHTAVLFLMFPLALPYSFADDDTGPSVKISGYGTGALTTTDTDRAEFIRPNQATGVKKSARTGVDSNLGLQATMTVNEWLSGTVQGLVRRDTEDDYGAELAWAFVKAKVSDQLSLRAGRMGLPVFLISDYRTVGYANTMLRPPNELYSLVSFNNFDGVDLIYQKNVSDTNLMAQVGLGKTKTTGPTDTGAVTHADAKSIRIINLVAEHGPVQLRFGRLDLKLTINDVELLNQIVGVLRTVGGGFGLPQVTELGNQIEVNDKKASFTAVGGAVDWKNIVLQSEYGKTKTNLNNGKSWYLMGGYRFGKFLPYYNHASLKREASFTNTIPAVPPLAPLSAVIDGLAAPTRQTTNSVGVRWDFHRSAALKVQLDRIKPQNGGLFLRPQPGFKGPVTVGAVAIDFVF